MLLRVFLVSSLAFVALVTSANPVPFALGNEELKTHL
jgi:hypothetical protein